MKQLPVAVTRNVGRALLKTRKSSPTLLFVSGIVGVVATTVLTSKATLKLEETLETTQTYIEKAQRLRDEKRVDYSEQDYKKDMAVIYTRAAVSVCKLYWPGVVVGGLSIAALTGSHVVLTKRNVALTAAYASLSKGFDEYRERVIKEVGEEKEREIRYDAEDAVRTDEKGKEIKTGKKKVGLNSASIYARFFDNTNRNWSPEPSYNIMFLRAQQNYANDILKARGHVLLNDVYDSLGIDRSPEGAVVGWLWQNKKGDNYVDFGLFDREMNERQFDFFTGREGAVLLDFNVDGVIYDKI